MTVEELTEDFGVTLKHMAEQSYKPMTNGDRIRAMSDEELADIICCPIDGDTGLCLGIYDCLACCLKWLKQPAEVET